MIIFPAMIKWYFPLSLSKNCLLQPDRSQKRSSIHELLHGWSWSCAGTCASLLGLAGWSLCSGGSWEWLGYRYRYYIMLSTTTTSPKLVMAEWMEMEILIDIWKFSQWHYLPGINSPLLCFHCCHFYPFPFSPSLEEVVVCIQMAYIIIYI